MSEKNQNFRHLKSKHLSMVRFKFWFFYLNSLTKIESFLWITYIRILLIRARYIIWKFSLKSLRLTRDSLVRQSIISPAKQDFIILCLKFLIISIFPIDSSWCRFFTSSSNSISKPFSPPSPQKKNHQREINWTLQQHPYIARKIWLHFRFSKIHSSKNYLNSVHP